MVCFFRHLVSTFLFLFSLQTPSCHYSSPTYFSEKEKKKGRGGEMKKKRTQIFLETKIFFGFLKKCICSVFEKIFVGFMG